MSNQRVVRYFFLLIQANIKVCIYDKYSDHMNFVVPCTYLLKQSMTITVIMLNAEGLLLSFRNFIYILGNDFISV